MPWTGHLRTRIGRLAIDHEPTGPPAAFPHRGAYRAGPPHQAATEHLQQVMDLSLRCGAQLLAHGAAAVDVESAVHAAATTLGLAHVEVDLIYTSLWISAVHQGQPVASSRVVRQGVPDYRRLTQLHQLLTDIVEGRASLAEAQERLAAIESQRNTHRQRVVLVANGVLAGSVAASLGAGWLITLVATVTGLIIAWLIGQLSDPRMPAFFLAALGGMVAVTVSAGLTLMDADIRPSLVVAASIIVLLPGVALVGSGRDALVGFPLTAAGRAADGAIVIAGIVAGVLIGLAAAAAVSVEMQIIPTDSVEPTALALRAVAGAIAAASVAVIYQAPWRLVLTSLLVGAVGFLSAEGFSALFDRTVFAYAAAAVVVGIAATIAARRTNTLAMVFVVPGIVPLLPGLTIYRGALLITSDELLAGLVVLLEAAVLMVALAAGALLGELLVDRRREA